MLRHSPSKAANGFVTNWNSDESGLQIESSAFRARAWVFRIEERSTPLSPEKSRIARADRRRPETDRGLRPPRRILLARAPWKHVRSRYAPATTRWSPSARHGCATDKRLCFDDFASTTLCTMALTVCQHDQRLVVGRRAAQPRQRGQPFRENAAMRRYPVVGVAFPGRNGITADQIKNSRSSGQVAACGAPSRQTTACLPPAVLAAPHPRQIGDDNPQRPSRHWRVSARLG